MRIPVAVAVAVPYIALEVVWLSFSISRIYAPLYARVQGTEAWERKSSAQIAVAAVVAYAILVAGISMFALDGDPSRMSYRAAAARGAMFGFVVYGVYNLTNFVAFRDWSAATSLLDTTWGTVVVAVVSVAAKFICEISDTRRPAPPTDISE